MKKLLLITIVVLTGFNSISQNKYWVFFTDKSGVQFDPYEYFDQKAIERRQKHNVSLYDITDYPVRSDYITKVKKIVDSTNIITRWFNGISVYASESQIQELKRSSFVRDVRPILTSSHVAEINSGTPLSSSDNTLINNELNAMQGKLFRDKKIDGKGVRIAVFDAGFPGVDTLQVFEHLRSTKRILKTYDFHKKSEDVYHFNAHGTNVLSCIAGVINGKHLGLATGAEFLLARTEITREIFVEEEYWLAAAEWADKNGADLISSSLGYTMPRYFQEEMDGQATLVAKAAKMASDKGILVINAMGNDGSSKWKVVGTPADVEEVLSIGGVDPANNIHINFSSVGPTADKRMKPNVCAAGEAVVAMPKGGFAQHFGTSFSTPLITGFAACALQTDKTMTNMQLKEKIEKSGHLYPYFDYAHGFGIPQASFFTDHDNTPTEETFTATYADNNIKIKINDNQKENHIGNYFYYKIEYSDKTISEYSVINNLPTNFDIKIKEYSVPVKFVAYYNGYVYELKINK